MKAWVGLVDSQHRDKSIYECVMHTTLIAYVWPTRCWLMLGEAAPNGACTAVCLSSVKWLAHKDRPNMFMIQLHTNASYNMIKR
jgi:hypothetical protein